VKSRATKLVEHGILEEDAVRNANLGLGRPDPTFGAHACHVVVGADMVTWDRSG
jgi:hypothetical protein